MFNCPVNYSATEENATVKNSCSGKDPLISISIALWLGVFASVFFLYLYWRHINLKARYYSFASFVSFIIIKKIHSYKDVSACAYDLHFPVYIIQRWKRTIYVLKKLLIIHSKKASNNK